MALTRLPRPYSRREISSEIFVFEYKWYWGKAEKSKNVSVMGFGSDFDEAYHNCLVKLEDRLDKRGWDLIYITNGVPLVNGANYQYHLSAALVKVAKDTDTPTPTASSQVGLQNRLEDP